MTSGLSVRLACVAAEDPLGRCAWPENAALELNGQRLAVPSTPPAAKGAKCRRRRRCST